MYVISALELAPPIKEGSNSTLVSSWEACWHICVCAIFVFRLARVHAVVVGVRVWHVGAHLQTRVVHDTVACREPVTKCAGTVLNACMFENLGVALAWLVLRRPAH